MKHMMIDVEAMGKDRPWAIPLMNVGVAIFDERASVISSHDYYVDPDWIPRKFALVEPETVEWWHNQPSWPTLSHRIKTRGRPCLNILRELSHLYRKRECKRVWFCGPLYDGVLLQSYYSYYNLKCPWKFSQVRDFRTVREEWKGVIKQEKPHVSHLAVEDAISQVAQMKLISDYRQRGWD